MQHTIPFIHTKATPRHHHTPRKKPTTTPPLKRHYTITEDPLSNETKVNMEKLHFPCLEPEGEVDVTFELFSGYNTATLEEDFELKSGKRLKGVQIAFETWGNLNEDASNAIFIGTGLSANSHAKSHEKNQSKGWWEGFIGPGMALDTDKYFVVCSNVLGGCYGTTGPSSVNPVTGHRYAASFPMITLWDMVELQYKLMDHLGIKKLHAYVGASLGGMMTLAFAAKRKDKVERIVSISGAAYSLTYSIALRSMQRKILMNDPAWNMGDYYGKKFPYTGMKLSRQLGFITYRSGPEWELRFGRSRKSMDSHLCEEYDIEDYLNRKGDEYVGRYDPNSLLWISKAMDNFNMSDIGTGDTEKERIHSAMSKITCPSLILGVQTDILFPVTQQRQIARLLKSTGNSWVTYYEIDSIYGHDTFLLNLPEISAAIKGHLESSIPQLKQKVQRFPPSMLD
eukprot:TRINITY_DN1338_c0_g1_i1.p1 TRINITY_DN1338_c0_g1~~TRINITY_DN1338_c0_g1_i1.p1  ORF type:complete len:453 (-),score=75.05 TRINITY_DN1338_c0_g1_i1:40-1398(-)